MDTLPRDRTAELLERHLDEDFDRFLPEGDTPRASQLAEVADRFGCALPNEFIAHSIGPCAGIHVEAKETVWPRPKGGRAWMFLHGLYVYGLRSDTPTWMHLERAAEEFHAATGQQRLPCLKVIGDADIYAFDAFGAIARWDHEANAFEAFGGSFFELLDHELALLRQRKERRRGA
jgi:hypothetical protein